MFGEMHSSIHITHEVEGFSLLPSLVALAQVLLFYCVGQLRGQDRRYYNISYCSFYGACSSVANVVGNLAITYPIKEIIWASEQLNAPHMHFPKNLQNAWSNAQDIPPPLHAFLYPTRFINLAWTTLLILAQTIGACCGVAFDLSLPLIHPD